MKKGYLVIGGIILLAFWAVVKYNGIIPLDEEAKKQWSNVENVYQKRAELAPNLVAVAKEYADFEKETLTGVIEARSKATEVNINADNLTPEKIAQFQQAQAGMTSALSRLLATFERYPDLKANQNFMALQTELSSIANEIVFERQKFNETVKEYNAHIKEIPTNFIAKLVGFTEKGYFKADPGNEKPQDVKELFDR